MNTSLEKENFSVPTSSQLLLETDTIPEISIETGPNSSAVNSMTSKTIDEISSRVEEVFAKLQRNLEHNTRIFQEKSQGLLGRIDQAEEQIRKVLAQLETAVSSGDKGGSGSDSTGKQETGTVVATTESIDLSEEITKLEADDTTEN